MGRKVKKTTILLLMLLVSSLFVFAASITYVYGNNISSVDTESTFRRGQVFTDSSSNVLVLKRFYQKHQQQDGCLFHFTAHCLMISTISAQASFMASRAAHSVRLW